MSMEPSGDSPSASLWNLMILRESASAHLWESARNPWPLSVVMARLSSRSPILDMVPSVSSPMFVIPMAS